jgi:heterotetrameric sarcosine oxidase gamma subunit
MDPASTTVNGAAAALRQAGIGQTHYATPELALDALDGQALVRLHAYEPCPDAGPEPLELPDRTGGVAGSDPLALCLGPGEWLLLSPTIPSADLLRRAQAAVAMRSAAAYDFSSGLAGFRVSGAATAWLLGKLSCVDFDALCAGPRCCLRTRAGDAALTILIHGDEHKTPVADLFVDRSLAAYLWALLLDAAPHAEELHRDLGAAA